jgi:5'-nucleotidase
MILLADLDNTLVDRRAAFTAWTSAFVDAIGGSTDDETWLLSEDADGYRPRATLAQLMIERFRLATDRDRLVERLLHEHVDFIHTYPGVRSSLEALAAQGTPVVVVTNGTVTQQNAKLSRTGLLTLVDAVVISEAVGVKKPDQRIFAIALDQARRLGGAGTTWMVGAHPVAHIAGARIAASAPAGSATETSG